MKFVLFSSVESGSIEVSIKQIGNKFVAVTFLTVMTFISHTALAKEKADAWKNTAGKLTAMLVITDKPKEYTKKWSKDKDELPIGMIVSTVKKSKLVVALVFFKGCGGDRYKRCDAEIKFSVYKPNGKLYAKRSGLSLWKNKVITSGLMLSQANLALSFDPKDPVGKYKVVVSIKDNISNKNMTLVRYLTVSG